MASDFLLPFSCLDLKSFLIEKRKKILSDTGLTYSETVEIFEYQKNNREYWNKIKLLRQVFSKALPIAKVLFSEYSFLFLFDNVTSHSVYAENVLCMGKMSKSSGGKQFIF